MDVAFEQNLPDTSEALDVCQVLQQEDLSESCRSIEINFNRNLENATLQLLRNLETEWDNATAVNPNLTTPEKIRIKNYLSSRMLRFFEIFMERCRVTRVNVISYLPRISEVRQQYISKLTSFNETLQEFIINETDEIRTILTQLETEKDFLRRTHNELLIEYNYQVLDLQTQLDNFKRGIITVADPASGQENLESFSELIQEWRDMCEIPEETEEEKMARNTQFNTWKDMLRLPSNWVVEIRSPQPEVFEYISFDPENMTVPPYTFEPTVPPQPVGQEIVVPSPSVSQEVVVPSPSVSREVVIPSFGEGEFSVPSPGLSQVNIPSPSRLDEISVPSTSAHQPLDVVSPPAVVTEPSEAPLPVYAQQVPSPTYTQRSSGSSLLGSDEFRPRSTIRDTPLHRKHIENENLLRRIKKSYGKLRNDVSVYTRGNRFSDTYQEIQQLNTTVKDLSREWRTLREEPPRRDEDGRDRERGERTGRQNVQRTSMKSVDQIYSEWNAVRNNLRAYAVSINEDWNKIIGLQGSLETLYAEIEINDNDERILAAEEMINRELILLRRKKNQMKEEVTRLKSLELNLSEQLQRLRENLLRRKTKLETQINRSQRG